MFRGFSFRVSLVFLVALLLLLLVHHSYFVPHSVAIRMSPYCMGMSMAILSLVLCVCFALVPIIEPFHTIPFSFCFFLGMMRKMSFIFRPAESGDITKQRE